MPEIRVITYNMQGLMGGGLENKWINFVIPMLNNGVDYICLQECGNITDMMQGCLIHRCDNLSPKDTLFTPVCYEWNRGTISRPSISYVTYVEWVGRLRCHLAIVSQIPPASIMSLNNPVNIDGRPCLGIDTGFSYYIFTMHAFSGVSVNQTDVYRTLINIRNNVRVNNWFLFGDFNLNPITLTGSVNWDSVTHNTGIKVIAPNKYTHQNDGILDYVILETGAEFYWVVEVLSNVYLADHFPVLFKFTF